MHAIIWFLEFMNYVLFLIKFIKFKQRIKFKKFELQNYDFFYISIFCLLKLQFSTYENMN